MIILLCEEVFELPNGLRYLRWGLAESALGVEKT
jgi:hypothetical protein